MQTSPDLPTTVDFGNNLVNYIEVSPDDATGPAAPSGQEAKPPVGIKQSPSQDEEPQAPRDRIVIGPENFSYGLPDYLRDFDQTEDYDLYQSAVHDIEKLATPPSLPGFLGKPILNAATLFKDDNSVLNMPNHTVLNHLATSSIKNNVLAVSATTRYKQKVGRSYSTVVSLLHTPLFLARSAQPPLIFANRRLIVRHDDRIQTNREQLDAFPGPPNRAGNL